MSPSHVLGYPQFFVLLLVAQMAVDLLPPSSVLPRIKAIPSTPHHELRRAIEYVRKICNPPVRASRRRKQSLSNGAFEDSVITLDSLRADIFERSFVTNWLTALVSSIGPDPGAEGDDDEAYNLVDDAAALLAICAGTASAGIITRCFSVPSCFGGDLSVQLRDVPLDNHDYGSVGSQTWGGACVMAEMIAEAPKLFDLPIPHRRCSIGAVNPGVKPNLPRKPFRILELGSGTGLVSLIITSLLRHAATGLDAEVVATDYYPSVLDNLAVNTASNRQQGSVGVNDGDVRLHQCALDWSTFPSLDTPEDLLAEPFDLVFGSDIIYEELHASWIKACLAKLLRKPESPTDKFWFHLIIPLRSTHAAESSTIETVFSKATDAEESEEELVIVDKQTIVCDAEGGQEVEYSYYKIGWDRTFQRV